MEQVQDSGQYVYRKFMKNAISVKALPQGRSQDYSFDEKTDWVQEILDELNEDVTENDIASNENFLKVELGLLRKSDGTHGDYLILEGNVEAQYVTNCVVSGNVMTESQETEIFAAVLEKGIIKDLELEEATELFINDAEYDLYDYEFKVDLKSIIREYIFLYKNYYPKAEGVELKGNDGLEH